ncbi:MAG: hotdog fold thioesterase [Thermodesulfobacteriota bacterium]
MEEKVREAIANAVTTEPFAQTMGMKLLELSDGHSRVSMKLRPDFMDNIYSRAHGGAVFGLLDEAFETASQTGGTIAVAMNVNITYVASPDPGATIIAEANRISRTKRTAGFSITVAQEDGKLIATCQALAYDTGKPIPFVKG